MDHMRNYRFFLLIIAIAGMFFFPAMALGEISDTDITMAVEKQIIKDPGINLYSVDVMTTKGIVTLSGTVESILAKDRAVKVARTVKGVRSVVDRIAVNPSARSDKEIKNDIELAFILDPLSESWEVEPKVVNGIVTLYGTVDSWTERELVGNIAKRVKGVSELTNNISVINKSVRNNNEIQEEIDRRLYWDALVDDYLITVKVDDGNVVLTGTVGSAAERVQAHRDAMVAGVKEVDSSGLKVESWARNEELRRDKYFQLADDEIRQAVKAAFLYDPRVNMFDIDVDVDNGRVTLSGTVDNLKVKRTAATDARNTTGVWHVYNLIKVKPNTPTDDQIAANIRALLAMDPYVDRYEINIAVRNGEVYLTGTVDNMFEKAYADNDVSGIYGVKEIHNRLKVEDNKVLTYNPYVDEWYTYDYNWYLYPYYLPVQQDRLIRQNIEDELFWSPFVDSEDVTVSVDDGVATLNGKVDSWHEYSAAIENALEGGAVAVDSELEIKTREK